MTWRRCTRDGGEVGGKARPDDRDLARVTASCPRAAIAASSRQGKVVGVYGATRATGPAASTSTSIGDDGQPPDLREPCLD
jgi:hypothetical protein